MDDPAVPEQMFWWSGRFYYEFDEFNEFDKLDLYKTNSQ